MDKDGFFLAVDLGAGLGAKVGLFTTAHPHRTPAASGEVRGKLRVFHRGIWSRFSMSWRTNTANGWFRARAIGIASPGLFRSDGSYLLAANLSFLTGHNLKQRLAEQTGLPVAIDNDANLGGLAEWSVLKTDLLYWVFGGGWGGVWIDKAGTVKFPALDWDGKDTSLHYTNEPGFAIPLSKLMLKTLFYQFGVSFDRFEQIVVEDLHLSEPKLTGPGGDPDSIRAEVILSGPGRCRLFRAVVGDDNFYERFLDIHETKQMTDPSIAGKLISKLSTMRVESAVNTDRLFGRMLAEATLMIRYGKPTATVCPRPSRSAWAANHHTRCPTSVPRLNAGWERQAS